MSLGQALLQVYAAEEAGVPYLLNPGGAVRRLTHAGRTLVAKRRPFEAAESELASAVRARQVLGTVPTVHSLKLHVVVPDLIELVDGTCALVSPDLGDTLAVEGADAALRLPRPVVAEILRSLLNAGIEWSGFVPRNLFLRGQDLWAIDWEDARFRADPVRPDEVTTTKWDVGWSDVYCGDPDFRSSFPPRAGAGGEPLDEFEQTLRELSDPRYSDAELRTRGADITLRSELYAPVPHGTPTPAEIGHLADEVMPERWSVFHTALTAWTRARLDDAAYARLLGRMWHEGGIAPDGAAATAIPSEPWIRALLTEADEATSDEGAAGSLGSLAERLALLAGVTGLEAAGRRADIAEAILVRICDLVLPALGLSGLQLLLRGSLAQGVVTAGSDVDFELSGPTQPHGHRGVESLVVDALAAFGIGAEASEGRPSEVDLGDPDSGPTRDLHEWMELRGPGSFAHDPGWFAAVVPVDHAHLANRQSRYEQAGREATAKYLWFEARAALARVVLRAAPGVPSVAVLDQFGALPELLGPGDAQELRDIVVNALEQRELEHCDPVRCADLRGRLDRFRERHGLPGPAVDRRIPLKNEGA